MSLLPLLLVCTLALVGAQNSPNGTNPRPLMPPEYAFIQEHSSGGTPPGARESPALGFSRDGKQAYVIGGKRGQTVLQSFFTYDFNTTVWGELSTTRLFASPCYAQYTGPETGKNADIWMYGKADGANNELARFNLTTVEVVTRESGDVASDGGCTVTSEAHFFVFGGSLGTEGNCTNDLYFFNDSWKKVDTSLSTALPPKRRNSGLISYNHTHLYLFGGVCGVDVANDLWMIDVERGIWTQIEVTGTKPPARHSLSLSFDFSSPTPRLLLFGGIAGNDTLNDAWRFDITSSTWTQLGFNKTQQWPPERSNFGHAFFGGRLIVFGGTDSAGHASDELWQLVLNDDCFSRLTCEECVTGIQGCGWCTNNDKNYQCIAGASYGPFLPESCYNSSATTWTTEFLTCPLDEFPGWIIALVIIGCIVLVGVIIYFVMRMKQKGTYQTID